MLAIEYFLFQETPVQEQQYLYTNYWKRKDIDKMSQEAASLLVPTEINFKGIFIIQCHGPIWQTSYLNCYKVRNMHISVQVA